MTKMLVRVLAVSALGAMMLSASPAQAHHRNSVNALKARVARLEARVAALEGRTQYISPDGAVYGGLVLAYNAIQDGADCPSVDTDDDARFYYDAEFDLWYLDCASFHARQSVDAASGSSRSPQPVGGAELSALAQRL